MLAIPVYICRAVRQHVPHNLFNLTLIPIFTAKIPTEGLLPVIRSDYFDDYGQNQISSIQFSPDGLYLAIVTDDR